MWSRRGNGLDRRLPRGGRRLPIHNQSDWKWRGIVDRDVDEETAVRRDVGTVAEAH